MAFQRFSSLALVATILSLSACGSGSGTSGSGAIPAKPAALRSRPRAERDWNNLYKAVPGANAVYAYAPDSTKPDVTIAKGVDQPIALTFDAAGNLYVANRGPGAGSVTVYDSKHALTRSLSIGIDEPSSVAVDTRGYTYVGCRRFVEVYPPGSETPVKRISVNGGPVTSLLLDSAGDLYALISSKHLVDVYRTGTYQLVRTYDTSGQFKSMAIDSSDNFYLGIKPLVNPGKPTKPPFIIVYKADSTQELYRIQDIPLPVHIAMSATDHLYLADTAADKIYIYDPGSKTVSETIEPTLIKPENLALGSDQQVYVLLGGSQGLVVMYKGTSSVVRGQFGGRQGDVSSIAVGPP
jgi:sugar lactone lactonase YvrE